MRTSDEESFYLSIGNRGAVGYWASACRFLIAKATAPTRSHNIRGGCWVSNAEDDTGMHIEARRENGRRESREICELEI
jgi:hypothetical protein